MSGVRVGGWEGVAKVLRREAQNLRKSFQTTQPNITNNEETTFRSRLVIGLGRLGLGMLGLGMLV